MHADIATVLRRLRTKLRIFGALSSMVSPRESLRRSEDPEDQGSRCAAPKHAKHRVRQLPYGDSACSGTLPSKPCHLQCYHRHPGLSRHHEGSPWRARAVLGRNSTPQLLRLHAGAGAAAAAP